MRQASVRFNWIVPVAALIYVAWSLKFINRASFLAIDGHRYWGIFDDALISMRYAWNLSHGAGLVWNPGEHVEGYSNLLTTLLMAGACVVFDRRTAALAVVLVGVITVLATAFVVARLATRFDPRRNAATPGFIGLAFCSALAFYPLSYWSLSGMETGLLTLLFVTSLLMVELWAETGRPWLAHAFAVTLGLLCVTRPDGFLLAGLGVAGFIHAARRASRESAARRVVAVLAIAAIPVAVQAIFRARYYDSFLPNTFTLKLGAFPLSERLRGGLGFIRPLALPILALLAPILVGILRAPSRLKIVACAALMITVGYEISVGGDPWPYWRIMIPAIPLATAVATHEIWTSVAGARWIRRAAAVGVLSVLFLVLNRGFIKEMTFRVRPYQWYSNVANVNTALALGEISRPSASVGVFWAGSIPYYTGLRAIDFLGKSDPVIARRKPDLTGAVAWGGMNSVPGHNKYDLRYSIVNLRPTYVQGFRWGRQDLSQWARAHYDSVSHKGVTLWLRRGSSDVRWDRFRPQSPSGP